MLTAEQIAALRDYAGKLTDPINDYLIRDIAERIAKAGQFTSTAQYQIWAAQQMGFSQVEIKKRLKKLIGVSNDEIKKLLTQSAEVGYRFDLKALPTADAIPFAENHVLQEIVSAAVKLAQDDFTNITQTIGMVDPYGRALPLQQAYRNSMDFAFSQVATGAADYNTAVRLAVKNLAEKGIQTIDYQSGIHTSLEAAVRRSVMGGLGLMQEQISNQTHDDIGANGWEISTHAASAPDHEPIQGKQYSDEEYEKLNNSLIRRIGTLNCGHSAFPIILGVTPPQYTKEELEKYRLDNERGIDYAGKHYTMYEATQRQRRLEASIRRQKRRILADEATGDQEKKQQDQIKLQVLNQEYRRFSKAAGLRTQDARAEVLGFDGKQGIAAQDAFEKALLPKRNAALIPTEKFTEYALNPEKSLDKSIAFSNALGYNLDNADSLIQNIRDNLSSFPASEKGRNEYGTRYEVRMNLTGANQRTANVITAWLDDAKTGKMRLISAYVDRKRSADK